MGVSVSLCMIVRDEEDVLARCLDSVKDVVDEIILVDTGSTDRTKEIAAQYTANIYSYTWTDDFSAARNFSFSKATQDYILWLDADDILLPEDAQAFSKLKATLLPDTDMVMMKYHTSFDEDGNPVFSYYRERLVRANADFLWHGAVHEAITPSGKILYSGIAVTHAKLRPSDPDRNLRIFEKLLANGTPLTPREQFYYARELYYHERYAQAIELLKTFLAEKRGWIENTLEACRLLSQCYRCVHDDANTIGALLSSFSFTAPRAETCCDIGAYFMDREDYTTAAFWYEIALLIPRNDRGGGFVLPECYGYLPHIQLCVCYDRLGEHQRALEHNDAAGKEKPNDPAYLQNKQYFAQLRKGTR